MKGVYVMKTEGEKKGLFGRVKIAPKPKKTSCCCNIELEEIPDNEQENEAQPPKKDS
jgi:hypothetical protein